MIVSWILSLAGVTKSFEGWRAEGVRLSHTNLAADELSFIAARSRFDDDDLCAYGAEAILTKIIDGAPQVWFKGNRQLVVGSASGSSEMQSYLFHGPWRWLAENVFQQQWGPGRSYTSHLILNGTAGEIIQDVLDFVISIGAPLQYLQADLDALAVRPVPNEITGQFCASVIQAALQFAPDTTQWIDYTTTPPTLRLGKRAALTAVNYRLADYADDSLPAVTVNSLRARPDKQIPAAKVSYETINTVDGGQFIIPSQEIYPPGATGLEDGAFNDTVTLQGRTQNNVFGELECATINTASLEWFKQHIHTLRDDRLTILGGAPVSIERVDLDGNIIAPAAQLPRELIEGSIAPWMKDGSNNPIQWQREVFRVKFNLGFYTDEGLSLALVNQNAVVFTFELTTTNAPAGVSSYSAVDTIDFGDPPIYGLAQYLYDSLSPLHYDGSFVIEESECTAYGDLGCVVNLWGSKPAYQTMRALVQRAEFDIEHGTTTLTVGPPEHLTLGDILALLERFRTSRRYTNPLTQETGEIESGEGGNIELGKATANTNAIPGAGVTSLFTVKDGNGSAVISGADQSLIISSGGAGSAKLKHGDGLTLLPDSGAGVAKLILGEGLTITGAGGSILALLADCAGREIKIREVEVCVNNVTKHMLVLCSAPY